MKDRIALIGMRGVGKTTVGRLLAARLGWRFVDTDDLVEARHRSTIAEIIARHGEPAFRKTEIDVLLEALGQDRAVIATGGGCVEDAQAREALRATFTVWLSASVDVLHSRIAGSGRPPLTPLQPEAELAALLARRMAWYMECSRLMVSSAGITPEVVCDVLEQSWRVFQNHDLR